MMNERISHPQSEAGSLTRIGEDGSRSPWRRATAAREVSRAGTVLDLIPGCGGYKFANASAGAILRYCEFILYVADQAASREFYRAVLGLEPRLDVPGMTEFELTSSAVLGLMPIAGIRRLLGDAILDPQLAGSIPRCELYLPADDPQAMLERVVAAGGKLLSPAQPRNWGDVVAYGADLDGHVLAFAKPDDQAGDPDES